MVFEGLLIALYVGFLLFAVVTFFRLGYDVRAIRQMLENEGLFSGIPCTWCLMPVPEGAQFCGHCGRALGSGDVS
jgi:hypothetical protein